MPLKTPSLRLLALTTAFAASSLSAAEPATLTLESALQSAEQINVNVLLGRENVSQAQAQAGIARSGVLPNIDLSAEQRRTSTVTITNGIAAAGTPANRFDANLTGSFDVLNPEQLSNLRSAKVGVEVADFDYRSNVQTALATVGQTFFTHLRNVHRIAVLDSNVELARQLLDLASNRLASGVATQIDVTRAKSQLAQAQQARLQQDTVVYQSALQLRRLLNLDAAAPLQLADFEVKRMSATEFSATEERAAFAQRPDWLAAQKSVDRSKLDVRTARFERLPALALEGQYGYSSANFDDGGKKAGWFAGATVDVPVFDGLRSGSDRKLALSKQRSQELLLRDLGLQISAEIRLAVQDAASRFQQIAVAETGQQLGEEELRLARVRFDQGVADNREVIEAQNTLALANDNLNEAIYQYNLSRLELARVRGDTRGILTEKQ